MGKRNAGRWSLSPSAGNKPVLANELACLIEPARFILLSTRTHLIMVQRPPGSGFPASILLEYAPIAPAPAPRADRPGSPSCRQHPAAAAVPRVHAARQP